MELVIRSNKLEGFRYVGSTYEAVYPQSLANNSHSLKQTVYSLPRATKALLSALTSSPRLLAHSALIITVTTVVLVGGINAVTKPSGGTNALVEDTGYNQVIDATASAYIAADLAAQLKLPVADQVSEQAQNLTAQVTSLTAGSQYLSKPAAIANIAKSNKDIQVYTIAEGDTLDSIAQKFGITTSTISWANDVNSNRLLPGTELRILPINGVLHTVASGDTVESLASTYQSNTAQIISYNDLEVGGLQLGAQIVIPDGIKPQSIRQRVPDVSYVARANSLVPRYGGNGYEYGYCTWYAANRRSNSKPIPSNWGNANAWKYNAQASGFGVGSAPQVGAVAWERGVGWLGHVAYVEAVNDDGTVTVSEMNYNGWGVVSRRTASAGAFDYIY